MALANLLRELDPCNIYSLEHSYEYFMLGEQVVARQPAYCLGEKQIVRQLAFYCVQCGDCYAKRQIIPAKQQLYQYQAGLCELHGGDLAILRGFEWNNLDLLGIEVVAFLVMTLGEE